MDNFRKIPPTVSKVNITTEAPAIRTVLKNGITLYIIKAGTEDVMRIEFVFRAGMVKEYLPLLAGTTNMMLTEGTVNYSSEELNRILDFYGILLNLSAEKDTAGMTIFFLNKYLEKALELACEILFNPLFPEYELNLLMKKRLGWYRIAREKVQNLAKDQFFESVFGAHHPYGRQINESDFEVMVPALLKDFHINHYLPENMTAIISGNIHGDTVPLFEKYFGELENKKVFVEETGNHIKGSGTRKVNIEKPGAVQTAFRIGSATINKRHTDYPGLKILNTILGGYFGSRLMKNIREEKGYTYGIHSSVNSLDQAGFKMISTEVGKQYTRQAADEIYREIMKLQNEPVSPDELEVVRNYMLGEMVRMFDGPFAIAESFKSVWEFGMDFGYYNNLMNSIKTTTSEELMRLATIYYNIEDLYEITVG